MTSIHGRDLYCDEDCLKRPNAQRVVRLLREMQRNCLIDRRLYDCLPETARRASALLLTLRHWLEKRVPA